MKSISKTSSTGGSVAAALIGNAELHVTSKNLFTPLETARARSDPLSLTGFTCPECNLRYTEESWAKECEAWRREHKSCNLDVIQHAVQ